jgi:hypothetical protein
VKIRSWLDADDEQEKFGESLTLLVGGQGLFDQPRGAERDLGQQRGPTFEPQQQRKGCERQRPEHERLDQREN